MSAHHEAVSFRQAGGIEINNERKNFHKMGGCKRKSACSPI